MLLVVDLHEDFIDAEGVAVASVLSLRAAGVSGTAFDTPEANRFAADSDTSLSNQVFGIALPEIETMVEPDSAGHNSWSKSVALE